MVGRSTANYIYLYPFCLQGAITDEFIEHGAPCPSHCKVAGVSMQSSVDLFS